MRASLLALPAVLLVVAACADAETTADPSTSKAATPTLHHGESADETIPAEGRPAASLSPTGDGTSSGGTSSGGASSGGASSGGASSSGAGTNPPGDGSLEQLCVDTINQYRATLGLKPYTRWTSAETCSDGEAASDSKTGKAHGAFGTCGEMAQNECPGWSGPPETMIKGCLAAMWAEGPGGGHYENMRSSRYTTAACGFATTAAGKIWSVQNFK